MRLCAYRRKYGLGIRYLSAKLLSYIYTFNVHYTNWAIGTPRHYRVCRVLSLTRRPTTAASEHSLLCRNPLYKSMRHDEFYKVWSKSTPIILMIIPVYGREKFIMTFYNDFVQKIMIKRARNILILNWCG